MTATFVYLMVYDEILAIFEYRLPNIPEVPGCYTSDHGAYASEAWTGRAAGICLDTASVTPPFTGSDGRDETTGCNVAMPISNVVLLAVMIWHLVLHKH